MAKGYNLYTTYMSNSGEFVNSGLYGNLTNTTPKTQSPAKVAFGKVVGDVSALTTNDYGTLFTDDISNLFKVGYNYASRSPISSYRINNYSDGVGILSNPLCSTYYGNTWIPDHAPLYTKGSGAMSFYNEWCDTAKNSKIAFVAQCAVLYETKYEVNRENPRSVKWMFFPIDQTYNIPYFRYLGNTESSIAAWVLYPDGSYYDSLSANDIAQTSGIGSLILSKNPDTGKYIEVIPDCYLCIDSDDTLYCVLDKRNNKLYEKSSVWDAPAGSENAIPGSRLSRYCIIKLKTSLSTTFCRTVPGDGRVLVSNSLDSRSVDFIANLNVVLKESSPWYEYPYNPTPPHGGDGEQDFSSDEIPNPTIPAWSAVACGLCRAYSPTIAEVQAMAGELWSSDFVDSMKKLYNDPMEAVISFGVLPVQPNTADATTPLVVGNYTFTSASARPVTSNFVTVDCGEVTLPKQYDGFQDYEPYTKIQIYLPFIGNQTVTPSDVVGKPAHLYYRIDVLTGACLAWLSVENRVLYQWTGNCFTEIPLSKNSKSQIYSQIIHGIVNTITRTATGGVAGGAAGAALGGVSGIISTITDVATSKHSDVMRTGALNPASSTLGVRTPYFIISYPTMVTPEGYASAKGIPVNAGGTIGEFSGYTVVDSVHIENISATENELREIESLLTGGVIL